MRSTHSQTSPSNSAFSSCFCLLGKIVTAKRKYVPAFKCAQLTRDKCNRNVKCGQRQNALKQYI